MTDPPAHGNHDHPESPPPASEPRVRGSHHGLLVAAAATLTVTGLLASSYGVSAKLPSLVVLSLQSLLAAAACWMTLNAERLRTAWADARRSVDEAAQPKTSRTRGGWLSGEARDDQQTYSAVLGDVEHGRRLHWLFFAVLPVAILTGLIVWGLIGGRQPEEITVIPARAGALGLVALALSTVWLVLARAMLAIPRDELPEGHALGLTLRESQWTTLLVALALFSRLFYPPLGWWVGRVVLVWLLLVAIEQLGRLVWAWLQSRSPRASAAEADSAERFLPSTEQLLRELVFLRGNPVASLFETIEARWGVSFRSSWAIRFVRASLVPTVLLALLLFWGLSCLSMVGPSELGLRETFGRLEKVPLPPGLHAKLPWPLGRIVRFDVKRVRSQPVGYVELDRPVAVLWTNEHAKEEFALVLGDGTEAIIVNAMVYYKILEDDAGFLNYVLHFQNPAAALEGFGYRALMQQTRSSTVEKVLATDRAAFAAKLERMLQDYARENDLGIEVVDVALISLHPPIDAAEDYLEVISARIDAERYQIEAAGDRLVTVSESKTGSARAVADAKVEAAQRVGRAIEESSEFTATGEAYKVAPDAFRFRLRGDVIQEVLSNRPLVLVDESFTIDPSGMYFDVRRAWKEQPQP